MKEEMAKAIVLILSALLAATSIPGDLLIVMATLKYSNLSVQILNAGHKPRDTLDASRN